MYILDVLGCRERVVTRGHLVTNQAGLHNDNDNFMAKCCQVTTRRSEQVHWRPTVDGRHTRARICSCFGSDATGSKSFDGLFVLFRSFPAAASKEIIENALAACFLALDSRRREMLREAGQDPCPASVPPLLSFCATAAAPDSAHESVHTGRGQLAGGFTEGLVAGGEVLERVQLNLRKGLQLPVQIAGLILRHDSLLRWVSVAQTQQPLQVAAQPDDGSCHVLSTAERNPAASSPLSPDEHGPSFPVSTESRKFWRPAGHRVGLRFRASAASQWDGTIKFRSGTKRIRRCMS